MLTSFFGKSKPINFFLVSVGIITGYIFWMIWHQIEPFQLQYYIKLAVLILLSIFLILLLDFIIRKNKLTSINTYSIFFFGCMLLMIPHHLLEGNIILANLFLLLAFRRMMSLQSDKNLNKKILDSAVWITVASLFYLWSILFFLALFTAIGLKRSNKNYKHFLIPIAGLFAVMILVSTFNALTDQNVFWFLQLKSGFSFDFNNYENSTTLFITITMVIAVIWAIISSLSRYPKLAKKHKPNQITLVLILFIGLGISFLAEDKSGAEFFYLFFPLSILLTNAFQIIRAVWLKEMIMWSFILVPIMLFMMN